MHGSQYREIILRFWVKQDKYSSLGERAFKIFLQKKGLRNSKIMNHNMSKQVAPRLSASTLGIGSIDRLAKLVGTENDDDLENKENDQLIDKNLVSNSTKKPTFSANASASVRASVAATVKTKGKNPRGRNRTKSLLVVARRVWVQQRIEAVRAEKMADKFANMSENDQNAILDQALTDQENQNQTKTSQ